MIKTVTLLAKRDDWTREEFLKYWREVHGPLAIDVKNILRYVQSECLDNIVRQDIVEMDIAIDGVAEVWYESEEAMREARVSPEGQRLLADGAKFIGRARTVIVREDEFIALRIP
ncbi:MULTISPECIES: EthD domain-containing protein [unclassified Rhizobium]|uniref:EthD domain-containing protein n=1 Tax=unclassified Rhizobium TaxID=2613769 RepID=UPI0017825313|nr:MULTISPECIES: EthD domain-containing protein [unclassified Rhizobium]MBD8688353.1 EthD family reductase [Rhizobium sp. CFBP 13644]MBD8692808.1 EthD family reductase [Rhizobium sp. CFBP 13717]